jgi:hypothetical protein
MEGAGHAGAAMSKEHGAPEHQSPQSDVSKKGQRRRDYSMLAAFTIAAFNHLISAQGRVSRSARRF